MDRPNAWLNYQFEETEELESVAQQYRAFLDAGKTERECVAEIVRLAEAEGYRDLADILREGKVLTAGDKVYAVCMKKTIALFQIGKKSLTEGMNILCAHIDSPRLDIKQNPLFEENELAYLDTHYYGGVKKYQWVTLPLAIHGVVAKKDGSLIQVKIGEDENDPVVYITDLLIHLSSKQLQKKAAEVIEGEKLDILIGSRPLSKDNAQDDDEKKKNKKDSEKKIKDAVKKQILKLLQDKYGMEEEDFLSAELEIVPAGKARECGLDRSMIAAYGQDDRVCAFTSYLALAHTREAMEKTSCCLLVDKEEIGSVGATGMQSRFFENTVADLANACGMSAESALRHILSSCRMLSSDVSAGFDPSYAEAFEKNNAAYLGHGIVLNKYTGSRGKSGSNDANAEYVAVLRRIFDENKICFQTAELGKVDYGGGGTIAYIAALYGMEVIDSGVAVLSMHAPWEITSKADIYEAYKAYKAFLKEA
ncbi:MAG: aminopeptidase [Blautia sp.]|nr:aminopeptidase [Blautia sp.]